MSLLLMPVSDSQYISVHFSTYQYMSVSVSTYQNVSTLSVPVSTCQDMSVPVSSCQCRLVLSVPASVLCAYLSVSLSSWQCYPSLSMWSVPASTYSCCKYYQYLLVSISAPVGLWYCHRHTEKWEHRENVFFVQLISVVVSTCIIS